MHSTLTTATLILSALRVASAESCTFGAWSCQNGSPARCVYTSGVATASGYSTGWSTLETCASGCEVVGGIAQCQTAGAATTLVTKVASKPSSKASSSSSEGGGVFAQKPSVTSSHAAATHSSKAPAAPSASTSSSSSSAGVLLSSVAGKTIDATMYYDMNGGGTCGAAQGISDFGNSGGYTYCDSHNPALAKTLSQLATNNIVAMPLNIITGNAATYCGKKVVVTWKGVQRNDLDLFIWDGCEACSANDGLDFSSTIFGELAGTASCGAGRIQNEMTWKILDETVLPYVP